MSKNSKPAVESRILIIRSQNVLLDRDLAELYGVSTKAFNQAAKRNQDRFPKDFMFQLTAQEKEEVVTNCDHLRSLSFSPNLPFAFTEHGALMAANLLNSARAVRMSIYVIRAFIRLRKEAPFAPGKSDKIREDVKRLSGIIYMEQAMNFC